MTAGNKSATRVPGENEGGNFWAGTVNENGDESGLRVKAFHRSPFSSPFSLTEWCDKMTKL
jgi:hypothetical protein